MIRLLASSFGAKRVWPLFLGSVASLSMLRFAQPAQAQRVGFNWKPNDGDKYVDQQNRNCH
jgi:hypothetical protein